MRILGLFAAALVSGACVTPEQLDLWREEANQQVICQVGPSCDAAWSAAISHIAANSKFRFQQQTDFLISTYCGDSSEPEPCYQVTKQVIGADRAWISTKTGCNNSFGCQPHELLAKARIVQAMLAAIARVEADASGAR